MNFLKGILSICHSFRNTCQPGRINGFDRCFQVVDRCTARRHELVTPVLAKTQILNFYQPHMGKQKPKTSIIAQTSTKVVDSLHARICLRTCNLLDSYYLKIIFSEPSLDIRTSSFVSNYYLRKASKPLQNNKQITSSCLNNHKITKLISSTKRHCVSRMKLLTSGDFQLNPGPEQNLNSQTILSVDSTMLLNLRLR